MKNYKKLFKKIIISTAILLAITTLAFIIIFRYGFPSYNIKEYNITKQSKYKNWSQIFQKAKQIEIIALKSGAAVASPGARPYLDKKSLPADYAIKTIEISPIFSYVLHHPQKGDILIDAGLNRSFNLNPPYGDLHLMLSLYQYVTETSYIQNKGENLADLLRQYSITPSMIFLTHVHPDHISGLNEINNNAAVIFGKKENSFYYRAMGGKYLTGKKNILTLDFDKGYALPPFGRVIDIFGDASLWAISSPGHTPDHISYFINAENKPVLLVGDLTISESFLKKGIKSSSDYGVAGQKDLEKSLSELFEFKQNYPKVKILFSHAKEGY